MFLELTDSVELARVEEKISKKWKFELIVSNFHFLFFYYYKNISKYFYLLIPNWIKMAAF